jgi:type IV pilus assembly protein PilC
MFSKKVPLAALIQWCRALRHGLDVGLSPVKVFRQQAKSGPHQVRPLAAQLADELAEGESVAAALKPHQNRFPMLFVALVTVGEQSGRLAETFGELEQYFETVQSSRKDFLRALIWPGISYFGAILVIALLLLILGLIGDPFRLGKMAGVEGAMLWLTATGLFTAAVVSLYLFARDNEVVRGKIEGLALYIPGLSGCFRAFALQRFSMAMHMTAEAGLKADKSLQHSFRATSNEQYTRHAESAAKEARKGEPVADILPRYGSALFPDEFLDSINIGETTGQLAEVMEKQAEYYRAEAGRKLKVLTMLAGGAVYLMVGMFIIVLIFMIAQQVMKPYNDAMNAVDNPDKWLQGQ